MDAADHFLPDKQAIESGPRSCDVGIGTKAGGGPPENIARRLR